MVGTVVDGQRMVWCIWCRRLQEADAAANGQSRLRSTSPAEVAC